MKTRDSDATKARIFEAAKEEFAAYGIAGARVDRIAANAHANKQLIYAYFGDKRELFAKVLDTTQTEVAAAVSSDIHDLDVWIDEHLDYHRDHPEFLRLMLWEALEVPLEDLACVEQRTDRYRYKIDRVVEAQERGAVRRDMPPPAVLLLMMALVNYPKVMRQLPHLLPGLADDPDSVRAWTKDAIHRAIAGGGDPG